MLSSNIKASFTPTSTTLLSIFKLSAFTFDHTREKKQIQNGTKYTKRNFLSWTIWVGAETYLECNETLEEPVKHFCSYSFLFWLRWFSFFLLEHWRRQKSQKNWWWSNFYFCRCWSTTSRCWCWRTEQIRRERCVFFLFKNVENLGGKKDQSYDSGDVYARSPRIRLASWISFGMMVTRLAWMAQRLVSSNKPTK